MNRIVPLVLTLLLAATSAALAQPPVDATLTCDGETIGAVSLVGGELHVMMLVDWSCESGAYGLAEDPEAVVDVQVAEDGTVTVTIGEASAVAQLVPQVALEGKLAAHAVRAAAFARAALGGAGAGADDLEDEDDVEVEAEAELRGTGLPELPAAAGGSGRP